MNDDLEVIEVGVEKDGLVEVEFVLTVWIPLDYLENQSI